MRSLRRHLESHHSSPPGGATPGYPPKLMLYPELGSEEEDVKNREHYHYNQQHFQEEDDHLKVPTTGELPRPSSAPLVVPPEPPKRIQRTRRSSSGEESHMRLDPAMVREIEQRRHGGGEGVIGHTFPFQRRHRGESEEYIKPRESTPPLGISPQSSGIASLPSHLLKTVSSSSQQQQQRYPTSIEMGERRGMEKHYPSPSSVASRMLRDLKPPHTSAHHEYADRSRGAGPYDYLPRVSSFQSHPHQHHQQGHHPRTSIASTSVSGGAQGNMPYLLNIRNPFNMTSSPHGSYPSGQSMEEGAASKLSKGEIEARHQAVNTYLQMWANGQHNMPPEQLFNIYNHQNGGTRTTPHQPSTPTDPMAIAVAAAKEPTSSSSSGLGERHSAASYPAVRGGDTIYGIHPTNAKWQSVSYLFFILQCFFSWYNTQKYLLLKGFVSSKGGSVF